MSDFRLGDLIQQIEEGKEAMNVQLTGSKVEILKTNITVDANSSLNLDDIDVSAYQYFFITVSADQSHNFRLRDTQLHDIDGENQRTLKGLSTIKEVNAETTYTEPIRVIGQTMRGNIFNSSDSQRTYDVRIWGLPTFAKREKEELFGNSGDDKPIENIEVGSTFFEIDTTKIFMWDGTDWVVI